MKLSALDPRVRLALAVIATLCLALVQQISSGLLGLAFGLGLLCFARPPAAAMLRRLATVNIFALFLWCVLPFTAPGEQISFGGLAASLPGLRLALLITLKANAIFCVFQALAGDLPPSAAGCAMESLGCPAKLVFLFLVMSRYVHLLMEEWQTLTAAAKLRGFAPRARLRAWSVLACLLGLLLVRSYERSRRVYEAMRLRAFAGNFKTLTLFRTRPADAVLAFVVLLFLAGIALTETGIVHV